jgi:hypothetical protein
LQGGLATAAARIARGRRSFEARIRKGILVLDEWLAPEVGGKVLAWKDLQAFRDAPFAVHAAGVRGLGFELDVRRVTTTPSGPGEVRVRPIFRSWACSAQVMALDAALTPEMLAAVFQAVGRYAGFGEWRPGSKGGGPCGRFECRLGRLD